MKKHSWHPKDIQAKLKLHESVICTCSDMNVQCTGDKMPYFDDLRIKKRRKSYINILKSIKWLVKNNLLIILCYQVAALD